MIAFLFLFLIVAFINMVAFNTRPVRPPLGDDPQQLVGRSDVAGHDGVPVSHPQGAEPFEFNSK